MTRALEALLVRADCGNGTYARWIWFGGCELRGHLLIVPNEMMAGSIRRMFLDKLRTVISDLEVRVECVPSAQPVRPEAKSVVPASKQKAFEKWRKEHPSDLLD